MRCLEKLLAGLFEKGELFENEYLFFEKLNIKNGGDLSDENRTLNVPIRLEESNKLIFCSQNVH
jgi:hypothetical protein